MSADRSGRDVGSPASLTGAANQFIRSAVSRPPVALYIELLVLVTLLGLTLRAVRSHSVMPAAIGIGIALTIMGVPALRRLMGHIRFVRATSRSWARAVRIAATTTKAPLPLAVTRVTVVPAGEVLDVQIPSGGTVADLVAVAEVLAALLRLRAIAVDRERDDASRAKVTLVRRDALSTLAPPWPCLETSRSSLWGPIPVGVDESGRQVVMSLAERNVLLGGEPGAGKSAALSLLVATAALDPSVRLHLFDAKLVELASWAPCADHTVGTSTATANEVLRELQAQMDRRYQRLLDAGLRKVTRDAGLPLDVVVIDELAHYLLAPDRRERTEFAELLRDLVARGRAAGLVVLAATQKPSHDVIPTALRDLFGFRWALRCSTPQASDTVLGAGWAANGCSAADIDSGQRGVGYLLHEGDKPVRLRSHYLDDETIDRLARRAVAIRASRAHVEPAVSVQP